MAKQLPKVARCQPLCCAKRRRRERGEGRTTPKQSSVYVTFFSNIIKKAGYPTPIRTTRGDDILAACGQLKSKTEKRKKSLLSSIH